jgi:hypothetical protein
LIYVTGLFKSREIKGTVLCEGTIAMYAGCQDYRKWMELLGLQLQLKNSGYDPKDQEAIKKRIRALEKELEID